VAASTPDESAGERGSNLLKLLPHRYPFLMVDRVVEISDDRVVTLKNVTHNEPFFMGHFPGMPVMPGVLILEALAQSSALLALHVVRLPEAPFFMLTGLDKVRFRRRVVPGDQLRIEVRLTRQHRPLWRMQAHAWVDNELAAEGEITAMEVEEKIR
jgi:3-hydroxyacyl-[acyl-carrier-protein] dehydratase